MSDWSLSIVMIVPADLRDKANRISCALGHDVMPGDTFSVPLSNNGKDVTHYGCRTSAKQEFVDIVHAAKDGQMPGGLDLGEFGLTVQDVDDVLSGQIIDVRDASAMADHFDEVLGASGLSRFGVEDGP